MKTGLILSSVAHVGVLTWGLIALPQPEALEVPFEDALPVEIVPFEELSQKRAGDLQADPETPPPPDPEPVQPAEVEAPEPVEPPPTPEPPAPEPPAPEPPAPEPPAPEPPVEAAEPAPEPAPEPAETKAPEPEPQQFTAAPPPRSRPKLPQPEQREDPEFNSNEIAALLDRQKREQAAPKPQQPQALGTETGNANTLSQNEIDFLRRQLENCWSLQAGMEAAESIAVTVQMVLNIDGTLAGAPRILNPQGGLQYQIAAERALRAVQVCAPYAYLPQDKYDTWQVLEFNFDPSQMFRS